MPSPQLCCETSCCKDIKSSKQAKGSTPTRCPRVTTDMASPCHCWCSLPPWQPVWAVPGLGVLVSPAGPSCPASRLTCLASATTADNVSIELFLRKNILRKMTPPYPNPRERSLPNTSFRPWLPFQDLCRERPALGGAELGPRKARRRVSPMPGCRPRLCLPSVSFQRCSSCYQPDS